MSFFKRVFKKNQSSENVLHVFNQDLISKLTNTNLPKEKPKFKNKKLDGLWKNLESLNSVKPRSMWYLEFSSIFLETYNLWKPSFNVQKKTKISRVKKITKSKNSSSIQMAITHNNAQPTLLCIETLRILLLFRDRIYFENGLENEMYFLQKPDLSLYSLAVVFPMIELLSRSKHNQQIFIKYGLIEIMISICSVVKDLFHQNFTALSKETQHEISECVNPKNLLSMKAQYYIKANKKQTQLLHLFLFVFQELIHFIDLYSDINIWKVSEKVSQNSFGNQTFHWVQEYEIPLLFLELLKELHLFSNVFLKPQSFFTLQLIVIKWIESIADLGYFRIYNQEEYICNIICTLIQPNETSFIYLDLFNELEAWSENLQSFYNGIISQYSTTFLTFSRISYKRRNEMKSSNELMLTLVKDNLMEFSIYAPEQTIELEYQIRIVILKLFKTFVSNNLYFEKLISENLNFPKLCDFILWVTYNFLPKDVEEFLKKNMKDIDQLVDTMNIENKKNKIKKLKSQKTKNENQALTDLKVSSLNVKSQFTVPKNPLPYNVPIRARINFNESKLYDKPTIDTNKLNSSKLKEIFNILIELCKLSNQNSNNNQNKNNNTNNNNIKNTEGEENKIKNKEIETIKNKKDNETKNNINNSNNNNSNNNNNNNNNNNRNNITKNNNSNTLNGSFNTYKKNENTNETEISYDNLNSNQNNNNNQKDFQTDNNSSPKLKNEIINLCLNLFNINFHKSNVNQKARRFLLSIYPNLQLYVLNFF
ncbi:poly(a) RNA polymerase [Anaeramoeba flamelloides]|uniref:Poly(A) RNA polymerase n=1 Tax=Anaeramoeba flamelloides TaxID=1746091 RepID=A0ABQ8XIC4_9EUKA|nr:poly(a) RNA polymerase [Anaeramoeba flamelloides]